MLIKTLDFRTLTAVQHVNCLILGPSDIWKNSKPQYAQVDENESECVVTAFQGLK